MDGVQFARGEIEWAHNYFRETTGDLNDELGHWQPPGIANPISATYAHAVCGEDAIVQVLLKGGQPMFSSSWVDRTGISEPSWSSDYDWARRVRVDFDPARRYTEAVFAETLAYLDGISAEDLDRVVDLSNVGFGERKIGWILQALVVSHLNLMTGEISCLKGLQGATGYPH